MHPLPMRSLSWRRPRCTPPSTSWQTPNLTRRGRGAGQSSSAVRSAMACSARVPPQRALCSLFCPLHIYEDLHPCDARKPVSFAALRLPLAQIPCATARTICGWQPRWHLRLLSTAAGSRTCSTYACSSASLPPCSCCTSLALTIAPAPCPDPLAPAPARYRSSRARWPAA
jgi:hypothetical protein